METIIKLKWNWAGNVARRTDNHWTTHIMFWMPRDTQRTKKDQGRDGGTT